MTPQEWIAEANARWRWPHGEFAQEGATHLAAALKEVARLGEQVAGLARRSDLRLCSSCRQTRCMAQKERQYGKTCWQYAPNTNQDIQELRDKIARLKSEAERVVIPELTEHALREYCEPDRAARNAYTRGYQLAKQQAHSIPSSRALKDGEVAVQSEYFDALENAWDVIKPYSVWLSDVHSLRAQASEGGAT